MPSTLTPAPSESKPSAGATDSYARGVGLFSLAQAAAPSTGAVEETVGVKRRHRIPKRELLALTSQLSIMTRAGLDVASAFEALAKQARRPATKAVLAAVHEDIVGGNKVSTALKKHAHVFGSTYAATIAAGESSGKLPDVLKQLVHLQRQEIKMRSKLWTMLAYPAVLGVVTSIVMTALILFVLPEFGKIFAEHNVPLPLHSAVMMAVAAFLRRWIVVVALIVVVTIGLLIGSRFTESGRRHWDAILLNLKLLRNVTRPLLAGRMCRLFSVMLSAGVPMLETLRLIRSAMRNSLYQEMLVAVEHNVMNGRGVGEVISQATFIPPAVADTIVTAERTGSLGAVTGMIGDHFEEEGEEKLRETIAVIEPLLIVCMGIVVGVVVLSVVLPMIELSTVAPHVIK